MQIDSEFGHSRIRRVIAAFVPWDFSRVSATGTRWAFLMSVFAVAVIPSLTLAAGLGEPVATLIDPERRTNHFGWATSVSGNQVIVGNSVTTNIGGFTLTTEVGYADVFVREGGTWRHDGRMTSPIMAFGHFGASVAASGDGIVVGFG
ncbi:MAG: hypothetical protein JNK85_21030 [Verrucomicrobiales bacterium]|nr:hypothetical protein [Verrucomicrobiales bacterium]